MKVCENTKCQGIFEVSQIGGKMPGTKEKEIIECPFCGHQTFEMCNGTWSCKPTKAGKITIKKR